MSQETRTRQTVDEHRCDYCGAALDTRFYFCLRCATPYKPADSVVTPPSAPHLTDGMRIAARAPVVAPLFWTYVAVLLGTWFLSGLLFDDDRPDLRLLLGDAAILVTTCVFGSLYWPSLAPQFRRLGFDRGAAWIALAALAPALWLNHLYHGWLVEGLGVPDSNLVAHLRELGLSGGWLVFSFCVLPAVTEEIAFRGLVQHWLERAIRPRAAILLAAALFTALHFSVLSAPYLFLVGCLLGYAKWKTQSLYPSIVIHFLHNLFVIEVLGT